MSEAISSVSSASTQSTSTVSSSTGTSSLGRDDFMKILIAQLQNQDPMNPMEDKDFIAQVAQFSTLEKTEEMADAIGQMKALSLVGRSVIGEKFDDLTDTIYSVEGTVKSVTISSDDYLLDLGDDTIYLDDVEEVGYE